VTEAVPQLVEMAQSDPVGPTRSYAIGALGRIGDPSAIRPLTQLIDDPEFWIRVSVVDALGKLGGPNAQVAIERAITNEKRWYWRRRCRRALKSARTTLREHS
jgi:HEAT repeat protein